MLKKNLNWLFVILSSLLVSSCALTPPDVPLCTQIAHDRGYCVNTISSTEYEVSEEKLLNGKTWWEIKPYMIYMPTESWVELKKFIIKVCKKSNQCENKDVSSWERTVEKIDEKIAN